MGCLGIHRLCAPIWAEVSTQNFNSVADALQWVVRSRGARWLFHYLDDFLCLGSPGTEECSLALATLLGTCEELHLPLATEKQKGPASCIEFLGIELDSAAMQLRLPVQKLEYLKSTIRGWLGRKACTKRELQSLAGLLQHACKVVRPGRVFLRRIFETIAIPQRPHHRVRLNRDFRSDIAWWNMFLDQWNGVSMLWDHQKSMPDTQVISDASGAWGCGAIWKGEWLQYQWETSWQHLSIAAKELVPIVMAAALWGHKWRSMVVQFVSDNEAVVAVLNSGYARDGVLTHLLRCLFFIAASFSFWYSACHIPGRLNVAADAISRNKLVVLFDSNPDLNPSPSTLPQTLPMLVAPEAPDWTSPNWGALLRSSIVWH